MPQALTITISLFHLHRNWPLRLTRVNHPAGCVPLSITPHSWKPLQSGFLSWMENTKIDPPWPFLLTAPKKKKYKNRYNLGMNFLYAFYSWRKVNSILNFLAQNISKWIWQQCKPLHSKNWQACCKLSLDHLDTSCI